MTRRTPTSGTSILLMAGLLAIGMPASGQTAVPDSLPPLVHLPEAEVVPGPTIPADHRCQPGSKRYSRLERRVLKVWPYAQFAGEAMDSLEVEMAHIESKRDRRSLIDRKESELKSRFEGELRRLTVREGVILIRLIDREAQRTTFGVVQELKGRLSAFMWQGLARLFGHDLKSEYDAEGEDAAIEHILHAHGLVHAPPGATAGVLGAD